eukprot:UN08102
MQHIANPVATDSETTKGVWENETGLDYKTENDPYAEIKLLNEEIEFLHKQKITFAENAATEIGKLTAIVGVLSKEHTTLSTPYYKKFNDFNPVDSIIRSLGYTPNNRR